MFTQTITMFTQYFKECQPFLPTFTTWFSKSWHRLNEPLTHVFFFERWSVIIATVFANKYMHSIHVFNLYARTHTVAVMRLHLSKRTIHCLNTLHFDVNHFLTYWSFMVANFCHLHARKVMSICKIVMLTSDLFMSTFTCDIIMSTCEITFLHCLFVMFDILTMVAHFCPRHAR